MSYHTRNNLLKCLFPTFLLLTSCTSLRLENLSPSTINRNIILNDPVTVQTYSADEKFKDVLLPGIYKAEKEDSTGVYYVGNGKVFWSNNPVFQNMPRVFRGGLWISSGKSLQFKAFAIRENNPALASSLNEVILMRQVQPMPQVTAGSNVLGNAIGGAIVGAIIASEDGEIGFSKPIENNAEREKIINSLSSATSKSKEEMKIEEKR